MTEHRQTRHGGKHSGDTEIFIAITELLNRRLLNSSARRARARAERRLRARLTTVVQEQLVASYTAEVDATDRLRAALERLVSGRP